MFVNMVVVMVMVVIVYMVVDVIGEIVGNIIDLFDDAEVSMAVDMSWSEIQMNIGMHYGFAHDSIVMNWEMYCANIRMYHHTDDRVECHNDYFAMVP